MTNTPVPLEDGRDLKLLNALRDQAAYYADELQNIVDRLNAGDFGDLSNVTKLYRDLIAVRTQILNIEARLAEDCRKLKGQRSDHDIDFNAMRAQIGGRLDRLRRACAPRPIPE